MIWAKWIGTAAAVLLIASCERNPVAPAAPPPLPSGVEFVTTATGLRYADITVGTGAMAATGHVVRVHYSGWLEETGEQFETSLAGNEFSFTLGSGAVIAGWHEGIRGMRVGGHRRLVIPPHLAYGEEGTNTIPGDATLIFDITLRSIR